MLTEIQQLEAILAVYPRRVGKRIALKAVQKAVERLLKAKQQPDAESARRYLWKRAKEYAMSPAGQKSPDPARDFRPHPATWMNQDRFFDDPAEWQKPNGVRTNGKQTITANADQIARANAKIAELGGHSLWTR